MVARRSLPWCDEVLVIGRLDKLCDITSPFGDCRGIARGRLGYGRITAYVVADFPPKNRGIVGEAFDDVRNVVLEGINNLGLGVEFVVRAAWSEGVDISINAACDNVVIIRA